MTNMRNFYHFPFIDNAQYTFCIPTTVYTVHCCVHFLQQGSILTFKKFVPWQHFPTTVYPYILHACTFFNRLNEGQFRTSSFSWQMAWTFFSVYEKYYNRGNFFLSNFFARIHFETCQMSNCIFSPVAIQSTYLLKILVRSRFFFAICVAIYTRELQFLLHIEI